MVQIPQNTEVVLYATCQAMNLDQMTGLHETTLLLFRTSQTRGEWTKTETVGALYEQQYLISHQTQSYDLPNSNSVGVILEAFHEAFLRHALIFLID